MRTSRANTSIPTLRCGLVLAAALLAASAWAQPKPAAAPAEKPQYGGELNIGNVYAPLAPITADSADWVWKHGQDTGLAYEQLFAADLSKSKRNGGPYSFTADAWLPTDGIRGELAEKWEFKQNPLRIEIQLRKGIMFPAKPGVMESREFVADDVVYDFERINKSPKKIQGYFDYVDRVEATGRHTVTFFLKQYNSEWDYRFGWGYYSGIIPKEVVAAGVSNWKNVTGTGPFQVADYVQGNSLVFAKNPVYWDTETIGGQKYKLPFVDKITYRYIKDEQTLITALRTAKLDLLEAIRWSHVDQLKKSAPKLQWNKFLQIAGNLIAMRMDTKPFDDIRVRRAMNLAVDKQAIIKSYYGGNAELLAYPMHPTYVGYYEPLSEMPDSIKELYTYNPAKSKQLLAEAGYPKGFTFKVQTSNVSVEGDLLQMVAAYLAKVGVTMEIQVMDYGAYYSAMANHTNAAGYFLAPLGNTNPTTAIRKSFIKGQQWNPSQFTDPEVEKMMPATYTESDERVRQVKVRLMTRMVLEKAPFIVLPSAYVYTAWWPWVKNYGGELRAGAERPGPIHARIWVDQEMKKKMGF